MTFRSLLHTPKGLLGATVALIVVGGAGSAATASLLAPEGLPPIPRKYAIPPADWRAAGATDCQPDQGLKFCEKTEKFMETHTPAQVARSNQLALQQTDTGSQLDATPPPIHTGISGYPHGPLPAMTFEFTGHWTGKIGPSYYTVYAGRGIDPSTQAPQNAQALVYDDGTNSYASSREIGSYRVPLGSALPTITKAHGSLLLLETETGQRLTFDAAGRQFSFGEKPELTAPALVLQLVPGVGLSLGTASATLRAGSSGAPIAGERLTFTAGSTTLCSASTNTRGVASCKYRLTGLIAAAIAPLGYQVSFAGDMSFTQFAANTDGLYLPSSTHGSFATVGGLGLASQRAPR